MEYLGGDVHIPLKKYIARFAFVISLEIRIPWLKSRGLLHLKSDLFEGEKIAMNKMPLPIFLLALLLVAFLHGAYAEEGFPLLCRGGDTMKFRSHAGNVEGTFNILGLFFNKGTQPAGLELAPGQCSWFDRGMRDAEPDILQQDAPANVTAAPWFSDLREPDKLWTFL